MAADSGKQTTKVELREAKDKTQLSKLKKLRRRISASFGRLSIGKEETIHESDNELDNSVFSCEMVSSTNGYYPHRTRSAPDTPPSSVNGRHHHQHQHHQQQYHRNSEESTNGYQDHQDNITPDHHQHHHHHYHHPHHQHHSHHYHHHHQHHQPSSSSYRPSSSSPSGGHPVVKPRNPDGRHEPVKRHNSAGDMLSGAPFPPPSRPLTQEKAPRPKSEGHTYSRHSWYKRGSGFGPSFGRADSYSKLEQLGEGSYATVFKGFSNVTNQIVALKEIRLQEEEGAPFTAIREASLLKGLRHANIVTLHDIIHTRDTLTFVFEYVHTDLCQYLEKHKHPGGLNSFNVKLFLYQLLRGLAFCHQRRILHRDLKPQNLLISEAGELKLADFGLARAKSIPSHTYSHEVVTLWYRPPDVLMGSTEYNTSLDMWGVGCIFTEMISGQATFPGMKDAFDQLNQIFKVLGTPTPDTWEGVAKFVNYDLNKLEIFSSQALVCCVPKLAYIPHADDLASQLLQMQPENRISASAARRHEYFQDLPPRIHELADDASIFNIPGLRLLPETGDLTTPHRRQSGRSGIRTSLKI